MVAGDEGMKGCALTMLNLKVYLLSVWKCQEGSGIWVLESAEKLVLEIEVQNTDLNWYLNHRIELGHQRGEWVKKRTPTLKSKRRKPANKMKKELTVRVKPGKFAVTENTKEKKKFFFFFQKGGPGIRNVLQILVRAKWPLGLVIQRSPATLPRAISREVES